MNEITPNKPLTKDEKDDQKHLQLRSWGLFGQLVMRELIPMPEFDQPDSAQVSEVGEKVHASVMQIMLSLEAIDYLWAE